MSTATAEIRKPRVPTSSLALAGWVAALIILAYLPILIRLVRQWSNDDDMGHGFFVPIIAGWIAWQKLQESDLPEACPDWRAMALLVWGAVQEYSGTLGAELFISRTAVVITVIGAVWLFGGLRYVRHFAFPLFILFFMVPIPSIIYTQITFPLQLFASSVAETALGLLGIAVGREGNVLELSTMRLNVVDACSGIRSLLSLTFLSLVYGYFFETQRGIRVLLFLSTIPIAILANAGRVTMTGILAEYKPSLADGLAHEAEGWVVFMIAMLIMIGVHQLLVRGWKLVKQRG